MLAGPNPAAGGVAWSAALPPAPDRGQDALVGLRLDDRVLKTRWLLQRSGDRWRFRDVVLSDPGISLAQATAASFGTRPLAAARGFAHPYDLLPPSAGAPSRQSEERAREAERAGRAEEARAAWERAVSEGAPAGPVAYERALAAKQRGNVASARALFESALAASPPSPGAAKELAALDASQGRLPEAEGQIARYLAAAGPDPEALTLAAVIATDLGKTADAVASIAEARRLSADGSRGAELEARIRARAGDASGAVALLRPLADAGGPDRAALRADPAYLPIATDPVWVAFLNESAVDGPQSTGKKP
jgi:tetratricopeptide (TPR) repeat protein